MDLWWQLAMSLSPYLLPRDCVSIQKLVNVGICWPRELDNHRPMMHAVVNTFTFKSICRANCNFGKGSNVAIVEKFLSMIMCQFDWTSLLVPWPIKPYAQPLEEKKEKIAICFFCAMFLLNLYISIPSSLATRVYFRMWICIYLRNNKFRTKRLLYYTLHVFISYEFYYILGEHSIILSIR